MTRLCRAWSSRDSPTSLPARSVASLPTSWRAQRRGGLAVGLDLGVTGDDDLLALPLAFRTHVGDQLGTLLLRLLAQTRGLVPCLGELGLLLLQHALGFDLHGVGLFDPPSIAAQRRSSRTLLMFGRSFFQKKKNTMAKAMVPTSSSGPAGMSGFCSPRLRVQPGWRSHQCLRRFRVSKG